MAPSPPAAMKAGGRLQWAGVAAAPLLGHAYAAPPRHLVACTASSTNGSSTITNVKVFYRIRSGTGSGGQDAVVHGSVAGGPWRDFPLAKVPSAPAKWVAGLVPVPAAGAPNGKPLVEFLVRDGQHWNKAEGGANFVVSEPGTYVMNGGSLAPVATSSGNGNGNGAAGQSRAPRPVMVVSDLDGTMVGDDAATAAFKQWWEDAGVLRGGVLVYNTGRTLSSFTALLQSKAAVMAHPDALISAVGTKVYEYDGKSWREDGAWSRQLDEGWKLTAVREAAYKALAAVGKDRMHFRPADEQNEHKVTCGVQVSCLDQVLASLNADLKAHGVQANIITSGTGDWRFLDIVPLRAGKLQALHWVRQAHGFPVDAAVACGDSGNDILMLAGENPAIVVGNAQPDLVTWLRERRAAGLEPPGSGPGGKDRLYQAKAHEARGILEGLEYLGFK